MTMFCHQCQETAGNKGCAGARGVCGKPDQVAVLQDLLIHTLKGISYLNVQAKETGKCDPQASEFVMEQLFATITNVNFDPEYFVRQIDRAREFRDQLKNAAPKDPSGKLPDAAVWTAQSGLNEYLLKGAEVGILATANEDVRSLRSLILFGLKGLAAYAHHAYVLDAKDNDILLFMQQALAATLDDSLSADELTGLVLKCGEYGVKAMALLDKANTGKYGHPEITSVKLDVGINPGILISGHDLLDLEELLEQTKGQGVDVYTHGEMLPANAYPAFKKYANFHGNYGGSWWHQNEEFEKFNGPVLMTTNCLVPPKDSYKDRVFTTGVVGFPGMKHIADRQPGKQKDFSAVIAMAQKSKAPEKLEDGNLTIGFAHNQVLALAPKVIEAVKSGAIKRFVVMAGCDGRHKSREYFTDIAKTLPQDAVILTAGCAKYRYNKLNLGDIGGIPRVLDAGQCNDSYSLVLIALALKDAFGLKDVNELPVSYDIAWYEQKAVLVLLVLLHLGVKNIHLGPTLPAFVSPNVLKVLVEKFNVQPTAGAEEDVKKMMAGT
ncbi:MAG: hydroxylamine reductase [Candidatus Edwardsbacteria bacterium RIFOXYD12_FULL_50_11]|uniref:Hydroxylamine reductase n=1 Tax=Candidatus Edwardsbacteria bacterium GWF2_54_11 TaxID=1817851 RepID=A0A1F5RCX2_9BACT|nr:MAG: hydroxylamine reductase [Candidatus Edwardsbacteria bacterium RifOxyC12_full_54_24]OGF07696.1 MAG: hydroxylamine reductase [Candidatus Edwardsbacteria bacterium RifOxyA12_full_54_48]OGF09947.1 MAG: hydroxylamine reductase [Candidatus Edwardsbacteria bacterium GWE2_54_12]OGF12208.1 MAG: hydroxylamine reductase [Candidatus Edwardsbacteria bacterium GWF2_54_11]OGF16308.1 MAG: hydroxylamine reductase [Candidatus Edwardsbacteria bacterium RIFOXYD12_FULL_50_11]OGJ19365.1 MAG: hydroxylamine r